MPIVNISSEQTALRIPRKKITELVEFVARRQDAAIEEVDIAIVTARKIAAMNRRWLQHAGSTDVLSFDLSSPGSGGVVAQIIVCADVAVRQAKARRIGPQRELMLYIVHGLLHVLGYDDTNRQSAEKMYVRQEQLLQGFLASYRK